MHHYQQPPSGAQIDPARAAAFNTLWLATFNNGRSVNDLVAGNGSTNPGGSSTASEGLIATFNGSQQGNSSLILPSTHPDTYVIAARIRATATQAGSPGAAFGIYCSSTQGGIGVGFDTSNNVGAAWLTGSGAGLLSRSAGVQNRFYTVFAQMSMNGINTASTKAWIDGVPAATSQGTSTGGSFTPSINEFAIGAQHRSSGFLRQFKGDILWASILQFPGVEGATNFSFTDQNAADLYAYGYPWNLFEKRRLWPVSTAGAGALAGNAQATASASGAITTAIDVVGAALSTASATGSLTSSIDLIGQSASVSIAVGELTTTIRLSADSLSSALAAAGLTSGIVLGASGSAISNAGGSITTQIILSAAAVAQALATADISTSPQGLSANAAATASGSASLMTDIPLSGSASAIAIGAGGLTTGIVLQSSGAAVSSATGDLTISIGMSASALAQAVANGDLSAQISLSASALSQAMASATISGGSGITYETPDGRVLAVPEEERALFIGGESRDLIIPAENRVLYVREVQP